MSGAKNMIKSAETTDWLAESDQQFLFDQFKSPDASGLKLKDFQEFLEFTVYKYFKLFPVSRDEDQGREEIYKFTYQQEMQLFRVFDQKNDHILDIEEFSLMCQKWLDRVYKPSSALVVVDVQNDFIDGSLALINGPAEQDGADVVPVINKLIEQNYFKTIVYTQDWHPADHIGFHANLHLRKYKIKNTNPNGQISTSGKSNESNLKVSATKAYEPLKYKKMNPDAQMFDTVLFDDGKIQQKLWPVHCVQNSWGAQFHPKLKIVKDAIHIKKGTLSHVDAYSAFWDNMRINETALRQELLTRKVSDLFFCGLALEYCVASSALDSIKSGFITYVIEDACRGIDISDIELRKTELREQGAVIITSNEVSGFINVNADKLLGNENEINSDVKGNRLESSRAPDLETIKSVCFQRALI